jgi:predicted transcriptional regulator
MEMRKDSALSFRVPQRLKAQLEQVALKEERSISQICEALLSGGVETYKWVSNQIMSENS